LLICVQNAPNVVFIFSLYAIPTSFEEITKCSSSCCAYNRILSEEQEERIEINNNRHFEQSSDISEPGEIIRKEVVSDIIYNSRIELQDAFYTPNEIVLVLNDKDAARTYELLRAKIKAR
jgi:hypothetical protein